MDKENEPIKTGTDDKLLVSPRDTKIWMYTKALLWSEWPVFRQIKALIKLVFVELAPDIPVSLTRTFSGNDGYQAAIYGYFVTFFFCFVVNLAGSYVAGTFSGTDPDRLYFSQDWYNLLLYMVVCPLYVGFGCWLIAAVIKGWGEVKSLNQELESEETEEPETEKKKIPFFYRLKLLILGYESNLEEYPVPRKKKIPFKAYFLTFLILGLAFFAISNYIKDIMDVANVPKHYWFVEYSDAKGRYLGPLGVYYFLLNFVLLVITLTVVMFFMSIFSSVIEVGNTLEKAAPINDLNKEKISKKLASFTEAYILAKWLTFFYMINFYIWEASPLGRTGNLYITWFFISLIGVVFVSIPRYFVELQWHNYKFKTGQIKEDFDGYDDIRPFGMRLIASILDTVMIGGFITGVGSNLLRFLVQRFS
ncbi:MAG TPA: hypothetical protein VGO50_17840 [Pyrinomonadaceae bacterium]|jgi:hypothetical protein|nr:hypothetical protein [Pyrinomonadaceae bacterium]